MSTRRRPDRRPGRRRSPRSPTRPLFDANIGSSTPIVTAASTAGTCAQPVQRRRRGCGPTGRRTGPVTRRPASRASPGGPVRRPGRASPCQRTTRSMSSRYRHSSSSTRRRGTPQVVHRAGPAGLRGERLVPIDVVVHVTVVDAVRTGVHGDERSLPERRVDRSTGLLQTRASTIQSGRLIDPTRHRATRSYSGGTTSRTSP